ncbi:MAG: DUF456 domain-containing protein [Verrucomicrobiota bacterium]
MDPTAWFLLAVTLLLFLLGVVLTVLPVFPGPILVFAGVALFHFTVPDASPGIAFLWVTLGLTLLTLVLDFVLSIMGARRYGATWKGATGALIGGIVGIFIPPPLVWIFIGPVIGAILGELLGGRQLRAAGKAGWGTFLGAMIAMVIKLAVCFFVILGFGYLWFRQISEG